MTDQRDLLAGGDLITLVGLQGRLPASTLAYRILCFLIADLKKKLAFYNIEFFSPYRFRCLCINVILLQVE